MKYFIYSFLIIGCLLLFASCNEDLKESETTTSLTVNTDLAFDVFGYQQVNLYSVYGDYTYNLKVNSEETTSVSLVVDESVLDEYNDLYDTEYEILPADYYSFTSSVVLSGSSLEVPVTFDVKKMLSELTNAQASNYMLPLVVDSEVDTLVVNETMCQALIHVNLSEATLFLEEPELLELADTMGVSTISLSAYYNFKDVDVDKVSIAVNESAVEDYNSDNSTDYLLLPSDSYTYTGVTPDIENSKFTFDFEFDTKLLSVNTYLLPLTVTSSLYKTDPETTLFCKIKITDSGLVFIGEYDLAVYQTPDNTYAFNEVSFDFAAAAELYGVTEEKLEEGLAFYAVNSNETLTESYTANVGYWLNASGDACNWGATDCALFVEYAGDGIFHVGQFPDYCKAWDVFDVSLAMVYNGDMVRYNIILNVIPEYEQTFDISLNEDVDGNYTTSQVEYDFAAVASALGTTESELSNNLVFYGVNSNGDLVTTGYTANMGFWYDKNGNVCSWGDSDCGLFIEYGGDGIFNVGQFPDAMASGESYTVSMAVFCDNKLVKLNITLNIK